MSTPSKMLNLQSVQLRSVQRLTSSIEAIIVQQEIINVMQPMERTYHAATQVKILNFVIFSIVESNIYHRTASNMMGNYLIVHPLLYQSSGHWYDMRWTLKKPGRSSVFLNKGYAASQQRKEIADDTEEAGLIQYEKAIYIKKLSTMERWVTYLSKHCLDIIIIMKVKLNQITKITVNFPNSYAEEPHRNLRKKIMEMKLIYKE